MSDEAAGEPLVADTSELQGGTETILIAEDEAPLRDLMRIILESFGYAVLAAEDGEEAERMFLEHRDRIRLVILDMIMPKKSGKDAADEIKKVRPGIRILFMSGYSEDMIKKQGMTEEGLEYVQKPVSPKVLLKKVRELLNA
jgi:DNA-binding response OmpR family regulator